MGEAFRMSYGDVIRLTYRQAWDRHVGPILEQSKRFDGKADTQAAPRAGRRTGAFHADQATEAEANSFFDQLCGGRKYEGPRFWIPGEVPGIKTYDGKGV